MSEIIIGIDLGTTNSEVAVVQSHGLEVVGMGKARIVPSIVGIGDDGTTLVGEPARNQYVLYPERTIKSIKRRMGNTEKVTMAGKEYTPQEISAIILRHLKGMVEKHLGQAITKAVITVPAYFNDAQRQATREAGEIAGLEVVRIINEPTAAALTFEAANKRHQKVLVYDLGGGTFDVSVVRMEDDVVEVMASHGDNHLGGDDFDQKIVDHIIKHLEEQQGVDVRHSMQAMARIDRAAEQAKRTLSDHAFAKLEEEYLLDTPQGPIHLNLELARDQYEEMIDPYVNETMEAVHIALKGAQLTVSDIDQILLVGGSTRTPLIRRRLEEEFRRQPRGEIDPDLCVAMGAAIHAAMMGGQEATAVLVDVTPYTFGTSAMGEINGFPSPDMFVPIIRKNSPIPVTKSDTFYTMVDNQDAVIVKIFQGEDTDAARNVEVGSFTVNGLSKVPSGNPVVLQLALDLNGVLEVKAMEKATGLEKSISIDNAVSRFAAAEMQAAKQRIDALFETDPHEVAAGTSEKTLSHRQVQARALVEKAERMLEGANPEDREDMVNLIEDINDAIAGNNLEDLAVPMDELSDILYYIQS